MIHHAWARSRLVILLGLIMQVEKPEDYGFFYFTKKFQFPVQLQPFKAACYTQPRRSLGFGPSVSPSFWLAENTRNRVLRYSSVSVEKH